MSSFVLNFSYFVALLVLKQRRQANIIRWVRRSHAMLHLENRPHTSETNLSVGQTLVSFFFSSIPHFPISSCLCICTSLSVCLFNYPSLYISLFLSVLVLLSFSICQNMCQENWIFQMVC